MKIFRRRVLRERFECLEQRLALAAPEGYFDAIDPGFIVAGWALDRDELPESISVRIRISGNLVDTISTGFPRPDVGQPGNHGFRWQIPPQYLDGQEYTVRVFAVDPDGGPRVPLVGSPKTFRNTLPEGYFDAIDPGFVVSGWALDRDVVADPIAVQIRIDGEIVDTIFTDFPRPDVGQPGNHGFRWQIPDRYMDGQERAISTWAIDPAGGQAVQLGGGPKMFRNTVPEGYFDAIDPGFVVSGWAADRDSLEVATDVEIEIDGVKVATVAANMPRPDVGLNGNRGFRWEIPAGYLQGEQWTVRTFAVDRRGGPRYELIGSPKTFRNTLPEGTYAGMEGDFTLVGWAWDVDDPARSIPVEVHVDGQYFSTIIADVPRPDLGLVGNHGFRLRMPVSLLDGNEHRVNMIALDPDGGPSREILNSPVIFKNQVPTGMVNEIGSNFVLSGWAQDLDAPGASIEVEILIDGEITERVTANMASPDQAGDRGFQWAIPASLLEGREHELRIFALDATRPDLKIELPGSPARFQSKKQGPDEDTIVVSRLATNDIVIPMFDRSLGTLSKVSLAVTLQAGWTSTSGEHGHVVNSYASNNRIETNQVVRFPPITVQTGTPPSLPGSGHTHTAVTPNYSGRGLDLGSFSLDVLPPETHNHTATITYAEMTGNANSGYEMIVGVAVEPAGAHIHRYWDKSQVFEYSGQSVTPFLGASDIVIGGGSFATGTAISGLHIVPEFVVDVDTDLGLQRFSFSERPTSGSDDAHHHQIDPVFDVVATFTYFQPTGDFDGAGGLTASDLDLLSQTIRAGLYSHLYDVTLDGVVDDADHRKWVEVLAGTVYGDANLDGFFDSSDLVAVFVAGEYEDGIVGNSGWATGDWNGDGEFDSSDLVAAFQTGAYELRPRGVE
jgi:hypothetical protein